MLSFFSEKKNFKTINFERQNFENVNYEFSEAEREQGELITPNFLQEQVRLPKDQWNEKFRQLIEEKSRETQQMLEKTLEEKADSAETLREHTFKRYLEGLGLDKESLQGKKVLDLGCGDGEFIKYLLEKGITKEAYGIDIQVNEISIEERFKNHIIKANFEENLPVKNVDYIISVGSISTIIWGGEEVINIKRVVENSLAALKENGEIRIYPIQEAAKATPLEALELSKKKWEELITEISRTNKVKCEIAPRNIKVTGKNNDIILESVWIIRT